MVAAPSFGKQAPPTGTTGLGNNVTLTWSASGSDGYWVCWDTINNNACDILWWPASTATTGLENLAPGTYYWQVKTGVTGLPADGGAWWSFTVTIPPVPADHWKAESLGNATLSGAPVAVVDEGTGFVDHSWGTGGPAGLSDFFSTRFTRTVTLAAGRYRFTQTTDDGSRLWVDDQLQIDAWGVDGLTTHTVDVDLAAGDHTLRFQSVEYTGGATAQLTWAPVLEVPAGVWTAEYFANMALSGSPASTVEEVSAFIDHPWGDGGPETLPVDGFSARFTRTLSFPAGTYRFTVVTDDGSRVWIDDQLVIDAWWDQAPSTYTADVALAAGDHTVRYECYENGGGAVAHLSWAFAPEPEPTPPEAAAGGTLGTAAPENPAGPAGRAAGLLLGVIALIGLAARAVKRRWVGREPHAALHGSLDRGPAASLQPAAAGRLRAQLPATALLLTAMLLVPTSALAQIPTQVVEYYHTDVLGSVRAVTKQVNGEWQVVAHHDFMPFGEEVAPPTPPQEKRLFTGKERDNETGLDYFEARYLRVATGRFTSVDPLTASEKTTVPQTFNRYSYVLNNPLKFIDPQGMDVAKACVQDKDCAIELRVNVIFDKRNPLTSAQKEVVEKRLLEKAQADFHHSNIRIAYHYSEGRGVTSGGQYVIEGSRPDMLNAIFTTGREASLSPGVSDTKGNIAINVAHSQLRTSNTFFQSNTFEHEIGHELLGPGFTTSTADTNVDFTLFLQSRGVSIDRFRGGLEHKAYAVEANPGAKKPRR